MVEIYLFFTENIGDFYLWTAMVCMVSLYFGMYLGTCFKAWSDEPEYPHTRGDDHEN